MKRAAVIAAPFLVLLLAVGTCYWGSQMRPHAVDARGVDVIGVTIRPYPEGPPLAYGGSAGGRGVRPLAEIADLIPAQLPPRTWQGFRCDQGSRVVFELVDGMTVLYGPCRKPSAIARLEAAMIDTSQNAHAQASPGVIVGPSAGFSVRYPQGWAVWGYAGKAFLAPSLDPRLTVHGYGLQAARGFSMQISDWSSYKYPEYLRLIALAVTEAKSEGASVVHSQVTIAGHLSERYHVIYPPGPAKLFSPGRDPRFLRACAACEAEYTLIRWPGSTWEVPLRVDVVAHPGTRLADYRAAVNATLGSLAPSSALSNGSHGYIPVGPHDGALETVMSFMEARIEGHRAESFLDASTQLRYRKSGDLYWFTHKDLAPSYQVSARVPIDKNTTRFEVLISESCRSRDICGIGRSHIEFLDVRIIDGRGTIVGAPGCRFSSAALRACLFSLF